MFFSQVLRIRNKLKGASDQSLPLPDVVCERLEKHVATILQVLDEKQLLSGNRYLNRFPSIGSSNRFAISPSGRQGITRKYVCNKASCAKGNFKSFLLFWRSDRENKRRRHLGTISALCLIIMLYANNRKSTCLKLASIKLFFH